MTLEIKYLGHSAFQFKVGNADILIDPFLSGNPQFKGDINELTPTDIFVTHGHSDHLGDAIELSKKTGATIHTVFELAQYCAQRGAKVDGLGIGARLFFTWGIVTVLPAAHSSSTPDGQYAGSATSLMFTFKDKRVYHAGDTGLSFELKMIGDVYKPDICLLPIGGQFTLDAKEAVQAAKWLWTKKVIPMHYNTFEQIKVDVTDFTSLLESESMIKPVVLEPSQTMTVKL